MAKLNGALVKNTKLAGAYIIGHDGIQAQISQGLYDPQDSINLSTVGNHMFMTDILIKVAKILLPFHTAYQALQIHKAMQWACQAKPTDLKTHQPITKLTLVARSVQHSLPL